MPGATYGSMLRPGVGRFTLMPTAAIALVAVVPPPDVDAAPPCRFNAIGIRLPPMTRKPTLPPTDVALVAPLGLYVSSPAVRVRFPSPSEPRAPKALPPPELLSGLPKSPLMVIPVPPLGLFQTGM